MIEMIMNGLNIGRNIMSKDNKEALSDKELIEQSDYNGINAISPIKNTIPGFKYMGTDGETREIPEIVYYNQDDEGMINLLDIYQ